MPTWVPTGLRLLTVTTCPSKTTLERNLERDPDACFPDFLLLLCTVILSSLFPSICVVEASLAALARFARLFLVGPRCYRTEREAETCRPARTGMWTVKLAIRKP